ncbi:MAG TPA: UDP-N-acetylglucosamine 1-carboxyvinyltransferase [archaeon]|nr:UDP-N-acetylglucosamine 1-carboxyvinyltransferase [archaeon]
MDKFLIEKSPPLAGKVRVSGAKNSCLALMAASLLTDEPVVLENVPDLVDVRTMGRVLENIGVRVTYEPGYIKLDASCAEGYNAPYEMVRTMRASYYVLGPLTARKGKAEVSLPGGCAIGQRPIDLHLKGLSMLGAQISTARGYIYTQAGKLRGSRINISSPRGSSVGATVNLMLAASLAKGETVLDGAAREPEIEDLARMLTEMGAKIEGAGTDKVVIKGVSSLGGAVHHVIPDRIEAGTFAVAAAITRGDVIIQECLPEHFQAVLDLLEILGVRIERGKKILRVRSDAGLPSFSLLTEPYPGFPTDMQAQFCALATQAKGVSRIEETIFENRFLHVPELVRLGADIQVSGNRLIVRGPTALSSAPVMASDLRASAALVLAALVAEGTSEISRIYHLDRGYEHLEVKLVRLGAKIVRVSESG